ncbi:MAG: DUF192 domain-containing protein [Vicinamibacterales bacterium]|jgi:hypothetical protein|nr:DUF192 domain-containing protein [Vicinamibacterales bacterium]
MTRPFVALLLTGAMGAVAMAQYAKPRGEVVFPDKTRVSVEIAVTDAERQRGLMFRERMAPNEGMVFVFDQDGTYPFWMKNTLIPLDMIWVDRDYRIVDIAHSVPPCKADPCPSYGHKGSATYVVEVVSGFARQRGVKVGDVLVFAGVPKPAGRR